MTTTRPTPDAIVLGALGALSGAVAWGAIEALGRVTTRAASDVAGLQVGPISLVPGAAFGLVVGVHFMRRGRIGGVRLAAYALASMLSYFLAYHVAYHAVVGFRLDSVWGMAACGVVAGLAGCMLLAFLTMALLRVDAGPVRLSVAVGGVAGALLPLVGVSDWASLGPLAFFVLWQAAYAASLAPVVRRHASEPR